MISSPRMKKKFCKVTLVLFLCGVGSIACAETITIATLNIRIFSTNSRDDCELRQICNILKEFDLVAVQEVRDTEVLERTVGILESEYGLAYRYMASPAVGTERSKEIYAFLYRADKVTALKSLGVYHDPQDDFIRGPFTALIQAGNFDYYASVQSRDSENDVLLVGDFNLGQDDESFMSLKAMPNMIYVNEQLPTTIRERLYDNIWFQANFTGVVYRQIRDYQVR